MQAYVTYSNKEASDDIVKNYKAGNDILKDGFHDEDTEYSSELPSGHFHFFTFLIVRLGPSPIQKPKAKVWAKV